MVLVFAFLLFSTIGLLVTVSIPRHIPLPLFWAVVLTYGLFAAAYAFVSIRIHWFWIFAILPVQFLANWVLTRQVNSQMALPTATNSEFFHRLGWSLGLACLMIVASYALMFFITGREGKRYFKIHAEVELASEIHRALVPPINLRVGQFEIYGQSLPSGEVGGDLVDAIVQPGQGRWIAYVADVSGHGVSSGVLMAMLKAATRTTLRQDCDASEMLDEVNEVFYSLKAPNSFATCAAIGFTEQSGTEVIVAGHLPILYSNGREVRELDTPGLPIGIMPVSDFRAMPVDFKPREILAIVTDGFTEVFDKKGVELGSGYIKRTLLTEYAQPLDRIASSLVAQANAWGTRSDDQSLLLVRKMG
jgi:serine/threonine protein phosphatase PrpC